MIEAEADYQAGGSNWITILNGLRQDFATLAPVLYPDNTPAGALADTIVPPTAAEQEDLIFYERAFWLYSTGHRLGDLRRLIRSARRGSIRLNLDLSRLDHFGHQLDRAASRITVGMILGSIIIGTAIVMTLADKAKLFGIPLLGVLGFLTAMLAGIWILASIRRGSRD